ncbi:hypothetical protein JG688_00018063, partial [Phytophthora aleatoria]
MRVPDYVFHTRLPHPTSGLAALIKTQASAKPAAPWSRCPLSASPAALSAVVAVPWSRCPLSGDPTALSAGDVARWYCLLSVALSASPLSASVAVR